MPSIARTRGGVVASELFGRDLKYVLCALTGIETNSGAVNSNLERVVLVLEKFCTVSVIGLPAAGNVRFIVEGLPTGNQADSLGVLRDIAATLKVDADIATAGATTWTITDNLSGTSFA